MDIDEMTVKEFARESEDNKLMQGYIWTKAYKMEEEITALKQQLTTVTDLLKRAVEILECGTEQHESIPLEMQLNWEEKAEALIAEINALKGENSDV